MAQKPIVVKRREPSTGKPQPQKEKQNPPPAQTKIYIKKRPFLEVFMEIALFDIKQKFSFIKTKKDREAERLRFEALQRFNDLAVGKR